MIVETFEQGSGAWLRARLGIPTASMFSNIVTSTGLPCKGVGRANYMRDLCLERLTGRMLDHFVSPAMERGTMLEPQARAWYELQTGREVQEVGMVFNDARTCAGSPDGLCEDRGIEIKCPEGRQMLSILIRGDMPPDYGSQVQGCMWLTGLKKWDFIGYTDDCLPSVIWTVEASDKWQDCADVEIPRFCAELDAMEAMLRDSYDWPAPAPVDAEQESIDFLDMCAGSGTI
jgi:hypothetical protein